MTAMTLQSTYLTVPAIGYVGMLEGYGHDIATMLNADSVSIPFGAAVALKPSPTTDKDAYLPATSSDNVFGIVAHSHAYGRTWTDADSTVHGELDGTGLVVGDMMNIVRRGKILVTPMQTVAVGDRLYVSYAVGTPFTAKGQLGNASVGSTTIDCTTRGEWLTAATGTTGLAWLDCTFVSK